MCGRVCVLALVSDTASVIQFLSYEGTINATTGPANGLTSTDIGVSESGSTPIGHSLQLKGEGSNYSDFTWDGPIGGTPGMPNTDQILPVEEIQYHDFIIYPNPVSNGQLYLTSPNRVEKWVEIYTMSGLQVYKNDIESEEAINISNLTSGVYLLKVEVKGKIVSRKIIVQ